MNEYRTEVGQVDGLEMEMLQRAERGAAAGEGDPDVE